jgi:hypothetical protein
MKASRVEKKVGVNGTVLFGALPFHEGELVHIIVAAR